MENCQHHWLSSSQSRTNFNDFPIPLIIMAHSVGFQRHQVFLLDGNEIISLNFILHLTCFGIMPWSHASVGSGHFIFIFMFFLPFFASSSCITSFGIAPLVPLVPGPDTCSRNWGREMGTLFPALDVIFTSDVMCIVVSLLFYTAASWATSQNIDCLFTFTFIVLNVFVNNASFSISAWFFKVWQRVVRVPNLYFGSRLGVHCTIPKKHLNFSLTASTAIIWQCTGISRQELERFGSPLRVPTGKNSFSFTQFEVTAILRAPIKVEFTS